MINVNNNVWLHLMDIEVDLNVLLLYISNCI